VRLDDPGLTSIKSPNVGNAPTLAASFNMRIVSVTILFFLLAQGCFANNPNDSLIRKMDSVFNLLIQNNQLTSKYCTISFENLSTDIDFFPSKYILTNIDRSYLNKLLGYSSAFFPDSSKAIQQLQLSFDLSSRNTFPIEFHYSLRGKVVSIDYLIKFPSSYLFVSTGYKRIN
jgi:tRNA A37 threonylcarbamoyladenosine modification protein TsaB